MKKITFTGSFGEYFGYSILLLLLSIITLGIALPYWTYWSLKYFFTKMRIEDKPVIFTGSFGEYFLYSILLLLLSIITVGIALPYWVYWSYKYFFTRLEVKESHSNQTLNSTSKTTFSRQSIVNAIGYDYAIIPVEDQDDLEHLGVVKYEGGTSAEEFRLKLRPLIKKVFGLLIIKKSKDLINYVFMHKFLHQVDGDQLKQIHDKINDIYNSDAKIPSHIIDSINSYKDEEQELEFFEYEAKFNLNNKIKNLPYLVFRVSNEGGVSLTVAH